MNHPLISLLQLTREIPVADQESIINAFEQRTVKEGERLSEPGQINRNLFFICKGVLRIVMQNENGNEVTHYFLKENQFCTIMNSFTNDVIAQESIQAACNAEVLAISKNKLLQLYEQLPYLKAIIDQIIQQALLDKIQIRNAYLGQDSATRYQLFLSKQPEIALKVSLTDIASYLGITPQSLSRIRKNIR